MRSIVQQIRLGEARHIFSTDPTEMQAVDKQMTDLAVAYGKARKNYESLVDAGEETELYKRIDGLWRSTQNCAARCLPLPERMKTKPPPLFGKVS